MIEEKNKNNINYQPRMFVGTDDFKTLLLNSDVFVDKSLMIKELLEDSGAVTLITRPRRWGKSLNMDMVRRFLEIEVDEYGIQLPQEQRVNYKLFSGGEVDLGFDETKELKPLKIANVANSMKRQGQFPVIIISFKGIRGSSYEEIESKINYQVIQLFSNYRYLETYLTDKENLLNDAQKKQLTRYFSGEFNKVELENSLKFLSDLLYKHFNQKVYILIDEYDTPINSSYMEFGHTEEFNQVLKLFRAIFGNSLKTNDSLQKGVITGILRVAKANLFSDLNNLTECSLLDERFSSSYGFTQVEVDELLTKVPLKTNPEEIKNWYNGYNFGGEVIYNPWSIMQCLASKGKLDHYWIDSGGTNWIDHVLLSDEMQQNIQALVAGKTITSSITKHINFADINQPEGLFSLLLFSGYLNTTTKIPERDIYDLSAPNYEVKYIYEKRMLQWVTKQIKIDNSGYYSFVTLLPDGRIEEFKERLQELLLNSTSFHQTGEKKAELFYSGFMLGFVNMLAPNYIISSEQESGDGRADVMMIPKIGKGDKAMIIEYKIAKSSEELADIAKAGLQQIINRKYDSKIKEYSHVKQILKISMAFCGKNMELEYEVTKL
ncbi:AAA family ATPase [Candidatus Tisiphia endosymbiont of Xenochironomus xenolabis]|uniref:AAA family ATPase n=1 Tax=Candidatus Tisiphia endosymbiont of Xenochironomus xenolabis TaxID=3139334 RepID=UPI0035C8CB48